MEQSFTHLDRKGEHIRMVDVGMKDASRREASARCRLVVGEELWNRLNSDAIIRSNIFTTAKTAGILAAKKTGELIPLCHPLPIETVEIDIVLAAGNEVRIECRAKLSGKTGVEMEALTGASLAALTVYDMCKSADKGILIQNLGLHKKTGGKSGDYLNPVMDWPEA